MKNKSEFTTINRGDFSSRKKYVKRDIKKRKRDERKLSREYNKKQKQLEQGKAEIERKQEEAARKAAEEALVNASDKKTSTKKSVGAGKNNSTKKPKKKKRGLKVLLIIIIVLLVIIAASVGGFLLYAKDYYKADATAHAVLEEGDNLEVTDDYYYLKGNQEGEYYRSNRAMIFYPGGKVEEMAYLPFLSRLQKQGLTVIMPRMPLHFAFLHASAAEDIMAEFDEYDQWILAGHSLGGVTASAYADLDDNIDDYDKIILMGSYIYGDFDSRDKFLVIYGSEDVNLKTENIRPGDHTYVIEGGNHAKFGNYGYQDGDGVASISTAAQQQEAATAILEWIGK